MTAWCATPNAPALARAAMASLPEAIPVGWQAFGQWAAAHLSQMAPDSQSRVAHAYVALYLPPLPRPEGTKDCDNDELVGLLRYMQRSIDSAEAADLHVTLTKGIARAWQLEQHLPQVAAEQPLYTPLTEPGPVHAKRRPWPCRQMHLSLCMMPRRGSSLAPAYRLTTLSSSPRCLQA